MTIILNHQQIEHKIRRIAYQIYETNLNEPEFILAGIQENGYILAEKLYTELSQICDIPIKLCKVKINKNNVLEPISTSLNKEEYINRSVVLVDDVLSTGTTLIYGVKHFLEVPLKRLKTAVLVDRNHKKYPVKADFKGISLSTSLQEHIEVRFGENSEAYLH
jgi:phosphoribosyltransferase